MPNREDDDAPQYRRLMTAALVELESLQAQLEQCRRAPCEPIAVIGLACRFPGGGNSPGAFWPVLRDGVDTVREIPPQRWDLDAYYSADADAPGKVYCRQAALVDQELVEQFSPQFFGIAPREAERMDPQQRMLLEVCWEALEDAGLPAERFRGSRTGVFVGSCTDDYLQLFNNLAEPRRMEGYTGLGTARSIAVGRVSYLLGLEGPALQLDTACSSSLVAIHAACASLRSGECETALAGGVNLQLTPAWTINLCKLKAIAPDGRCKTFDAAADGFGRGEGCGVLVLRRLSDALAAGDPIHALIRGSAVNHDGRSSGLTVPSQAAQEKLLRQALAAASLAADDVDYLEAHGTGTALGDPIEMGALAAVFHDRHRPLWVGSVKTNVGHLEAAAGIVGIIKVILALRHETIPPNLHFRQPNPHIAWDSLPARIPTQAVAWPRGQRPRAAGVSSFGFSGTNAHVVLAEAPLPATAAVAAWPCHLLVISAKSRDSLAALARRYLALLEGDAAPRLADVCFTAAVGRTPFAYRLAITADDRAQICQRLRAWLAAETSNTIRFGIVEHPHEDRGLPAWPSPHDTLDVAARANTAAERFVRGQPVDWAVFYRDGGARRISLPTYPFERQRYWLAPSQVGQLAAVPRPEHPLLGRRIDTAAAPQAVVFEASLGAHEPGYLADHRFGETVLLPATALLEMIAAGGQVQWPDRPVVVEQVAFHNPLTLPPDDPRIVQTVFTPEAASYRVEPFSRAAGTEGSAPATWVRHVSGTVSPLDALGAAAPIEATRSRCVEAVAAAEVYQRIAGQGLNYGTSFRLLKRAWRGPQAAWGEVAIPDGVALDTDGYRFHPALLDACLHVIAALPQTDRQATVLPAALERYELTGRAGRHLCSYVTLRANDSAARAVAFTADVEIVDPDGRRIARLVGLQFREVPGQAAPAREGSTNAAARSPRWVQQLEQTPPGNRLRLLVGLIRAEVAAVLGWESADRVGERQSLFDVGMDSLGVVELQGRLQRALGCELPTTLAMDYPDVLSLSGYIIARLQLAAAPPAGRDDRDAPADDTQRVAAMSDDQVQALLQEKYRHLL